MMVDYLESIDRSIVLTVNSWHTPFLDEVMWAISGKLIWIPMYVLLIMLYYRKTSVRKALIFLGCALLVVAMTDLISSKLIKDLVMRYRPSHHALLTDQLHFYKMDNGEFYKGGMYGFVSSHAANFFGICVFASLTLRKFFKRVTPVLLFVASLVCFSRLYLGVHYLSDLIAGGILGAIIAYLVHRFLFIAIIDKEFASK